MTKSEAVILIREGITPYDQPQHWADLGCGTGLFTEALAELLPAQSHIIAVDVNQQYLPDQMGNQVTVQFQKADFVATDIAAASLDGILMANALHFVKDKKALIQKLEQQIIDSARFLIIEYDHSTPNQWEPYPLPFAAMEKLFHQLGYQKIEKIGERQSLYGGKMFAAVISKN
ncbi:class I SAM-dependent methyltransferase [Niabella sp. CJ426]|uniref:class I SAM-dependent methyltransferase n=1 Tax=Niabella sp. CJ426 TaxID=3393740 RepID=UPI003D084B3C